jgi:hypothetical protein
MEVHDGHTALGEGFLAVPAAESDTGRWGSVYLADDAGRPLALMAIPTGAAIALAATDLSDNDRIYIAERRELLGVGTAAITAVNAAGGTGHAIEVVPPDGRPISRLDGSALVRLAGRRVRLEAHYTLPVTGPGPESREGQTT